MKTERLQLTNQVVVCGFTWRLTWCHVSLHRVQKENIQAVQCASIRWSSFSLITGLLHRGHHSISPIVANVFCTENIGIHWNDDDNYNDDDNVDDDHEQPEYIRYNNKENKFVILQNLSSGSQNQDEQSPITVIYSREESLLLTQSRALMVFL
jgi:hypothetical protein